LSGRQIFINLAESGASLTAYKKRLGMNKEAVEANFNMLQYHKEYVRILSTIKELRDKKKQAETMEEKVAISREIVQLTHDYNKLVEEQKDARQKN